jgi:hypothetical protein
LTKNSQTAVFLILNRIWIRIGSAFDGDLDSDPDPHSECGSRAESRLKKSLSEEKMKILIRIQEV